LCSSRLFVLFFGACYRTRHATPLWLSGVGWGGFCVLLVSPSLRYIRGFLAPAGVGVMRAGGGGMPAGRDCSGRAACGFGLGSVLFSGAGWLAGSVGGALRSFRAVSVRGGSDGREVGQPLVPLASVGAGCTLRGRGRHWGDSLRRLVLAGLWFVSSLRADVRSRCAGGDPGRRFWCVGPTAFRPCPGRGRSGSGWAGSLHACRSFWSSARRGNEYASLAGP